MQALFIEHGGDYGLVIRDYVKAEREGRAPRKSLVIGPVQYADMLWHDGIGRGWLDASKTTWSLNDGSPSTFGEPLAFGVCAQSKTLPTKASTAKQSNSLPSFDAALREMGVFWRSSTLRPHPGGEALVYWAKLIEDWIADTTMPLLVRKGTTKALRCAHPQGRSFVRCDNSPAHWSFMGAFLDERPTLSEVRQQLTEGSVPVAQVRTREESRLVAEGPGEPLGGYLAKSRYGSVNRFPNGIAYKLCHLDGVGLKSRGEIEDFPLAILEAHMRRFLNPSNMIVVPLEYAGVGECAAFLAPFIEIYAGAARTLGNSG